MTFDEAVRARRSVRGYRPDPVPESVLRECLELAQLTPSNCNVQPWRVYIASGEVRGSFCNTAAMANSRMVPEGSPVSGSLS